MSETPASPAAELSADAGSVFDQIESFEIVNGQLEPIFTQGETETPSAEPDQPATTPAPAEGTHDWEKRYTDLRPAFDRASQENARLREQLSYLQGQLAGGKPKDAPKEDEADIDIYEVLGDKQRRERWIGEEVDRRVEARLSNFEPHFVEMTLQSELRAALEKYPDFMTMQPHIAKVYEAFPGEDISFDRAYQLAKRFFGDKAQDASPQPQAQAGKPAGAGDSRKVDMAALQERAARVNPETGVAGPSVAEQPPREAGSFQEAFEMALQGMGRQK